MSHLHVCSLSKLSETLEATSASHLITLMNGQNVPDRPTCILHNHHLVLGLSDITEPVEGHTMPSFEHVETLVDFVQNWPQTSPLLIHCWAGISRSTAAAFVAACVLNPHQSEMELALRLRKLSPSATPNARIVALADDILKRKGQMVTAIQRIGRGSDAYEGAPFHYDFTF